MEAILVQLVGNTPFLAATLLVLGYARQKDAEIDARYDKRCSLIEKDMETHQHKTKGKR